MTTASRQRVKELFEEARSRSEPARAAFLAEECGEDQALRREVLSLLARHDDAPGFLGEPALGRSFRVPQPERLTEETTLEIPERIGSYEILGILGEGGMGTVYEARQSNPRRTVALKVMRTCIASPAMLRRFEHETQVLARLQHPGIAQIFEAGTFGSGRAAQPFFAMELISGRSLTEHCDAIGLGTRDRLALVARVCDAVQHAHRHGVVHRDLKPGNILVDETGQPKILDFGMAKATDADIQTTTMRTDVGQLLGTVPYMSPEQVAGDVHAIDTRSDVYALGVVCYEVLAGRLPLDLREKTIPEAARIVQEIDPAPLSTIDHGFRGDVETIVGKALEKDRQRRYQSASDLAADIRRHLADEPVVARPASTFYQLRKFTKRNPALVAGATLAFAALLAATVVSTAFWGRAERRGTELAEALEQSQLEEAKATAINEFLVDMLRSVDPGVRGRDVSVRAVLDEAAKTIGDSFAGQPLIEAELRRTIAGSYEGLGLYDAALEQARSAMEIHAGELGAEDPETLESTLVVAQQLNRLGRFDEAEPLFLRTLAARRRVLGVDHRDTLRCQANLALLYHRQGRYDEAETLWKETLRDCRQALGDRDPITLAVMIKLAWLLQDRGRHDDAEALYTRAIEGLRDELGEEHPRTLEAMSNLGRLIHGRGRYKEAEDLLARALVLHRRVLGEEHADTLRCMDNLGRLYITLGRYDEAEAVHAKELEIQRRVYGNDHPATAYAMSNLAACYEAQGRFDQALALMIEVVDTRQRVLGVEHPVTLASMSSLAAFHYAHGRYDAAEPLWTTALDAQRRVLGPEHPATLSSLHNMALLRTTQGRYADAETLYAETLETRRRTLGDRHQSTLHTMAGVGRLRVAMGEHAQAAALLDEALIGTRETLPAGHWLTGEVLRDRGRALIELRRLDEAETSLLEAHTILRSARGADHRDTTETIAALIALYESWERPDHAAAWRERMPR